MSQFERQHTVNDFGAGIGDNITRMERRLITMNLSAGFIENNATVMIASSSYKLSTKGASTL
jgi:hypothetical protein